MPDELTIGRLAAAAGVHVETIRYYQRRGLLKEPGKPAQGYRRYPARLVSRVRFIKRAQALGLTLAEIGDLPEPDAADCCERTRQLALQSLVALERKLAMLATMRASLAEVLRLCDKGPSDAPCPIIDILSRD